MEDKHEWKRKMKYAKSFPLIFLLFILCISISGCGIQPKTTITYTTIHSSTTQSPILTIEPPTLNQTNQIKPTKTPPGLYLTPTKIYILTSTKIPSPIPTLTPIPTIPVSEIQAYLKDLILNNTGCRFPCWWGITPGYTKWEAAKQFLESFVSVLFHNEKLPDIYTVEYGEDQNGDYSGSAEYYIKNGIVTSIVVDPTGTLSGYQLNQLLTTYGEPDEVSIFTYSDYLSHGQLPFYIFLKYNNNKTIALYIYGAEKVDGNIQVCPGMLAIDPWLFFGDLKDPAELMVNIDKPLTDVTELSITDFFQAFNKDNSTICLKTPTDIWK
jgi:hypothetical protein